ncbi:hypothetical protein Tco_1121363 [Tanacetum coccineum]|uniref:Uncharacterized protein n=1 Tax=Tanacetum coccineum TaxID=301880 RepID=A0ABQ5J043_9ASTR
MLRRPQEQVAAGVGGLTVEDKNCLPTCSGRSEDNNVGRSQKHVALLVSGCVSSSNSKNFQNRTGYVTSKWHKLMPIAKSSTLASEGSRFSEMIGASFEIPQKWDAPEQVDLTGDVPGASQEDLFGHDARPRPPGKQRPAKKSKSDATASTGGSSASAQFGELMEQELRLKREAAERAFEAQAEKDRTLMRLEELRFPRLLKQPKGFGRRRRPLGSRSKKN